MTEWSEAKQFEWDALNVERNESEANDEAEMEVEEWLKDQRDEELEKEVKAIGENRDTRTETEMDTLWDYPILPTTQKQETRSTTSSAKSEASAASTIRISYNTKLNNIAHYPQGFMQTAICEEVTQIKKVTEEQAVVIIRNFLEDESMEWEQAAEIIQIKVEGEMRRRNYFDSFVRKEMMDTIRGTGKRKWADQEVHDQEAGQTPGRRLLPSKGKKQAVEELITGPLSSRWSSQEEMIKRRVARKEQGEETRKMNVKEEKKEEERRRKESLKKREESESASEKKKAEGKMIPPLPVHTPLTSENMRGWFEAVSANMANQERKIKNLQEEVKWLRGRGGGGRRE